MDKKHYRISSYTIVGHLLLAALVVLRDCSILPIAMDDSIEEYSIVSKLSSTYSIETNDKSLKASFFLSTAIFMRLQRWFAVARRENLIARLLEGQFTVELRCAMPVTSSLLLYSARISPTRQVGWNARTGNVPPACDKSQDIFLS